MGRYLPSLESSRRKRRRERHPLLPNEYKRVFTATSQPLDKMLQGMSEPLFRTKLLVTIRRNKPVELNPTSILKMGEKNQQLSRGECIPTSAPGGRAGIALAESAGT